MRKYLAVLFITIVTSTSVLAQNGWDAKGNIRDKITGKPIPGATITLKGEDRNVKSDGKGDFNLYVIHSKEMFIVSAAGYESVDVDYKDKDVTVKLTPIRGKKNMATRRRKNKK